MFRYIFNIGNHSSIWLPTLAVWNDVTQQLIYPMKLHVSALSSKRNLLKQHSTVDSMQNQGIFMSRMPLPPSPERSSVVGYALYPVFFPFTPSKYVTMCQFLKRFRGQWRIISGAVFCLFSSQLGVLQSQIFAMFTRLNFRKVWFSLQKLQLQGCMSKCLPPDSFPFIGPCLHVCHRFSCVQVPFYFGLKEGKQSCPLAHILNGVWLPS